MRVLVAGASGFVGRRLCPALVEAGHEVRAMTRHPDTYSGAGEPFGADVSDEASLQRATEGCDAAYYLVHSLADSDFQQRDADAARSFADAAAKAGLSQIVYLGGLGDDSDDLSAHLRSRREVEKLLASTGVAVTSLRAGIIVGHGGISWEMTRQLVEHLPAMITPRWVHTRTQPIAVEDVVRYLVGVLGVPDAFSRSFDIGGPEVLEYVEMMRRVAAIEGRHLLIVPVPLLSPELVLAMAVPGDQRRRPDRAFPDRFDEQRGGRARRQHPSGGAVRSAGLRRGRPDGPGRAGPPASRARPGERIVKRPAGLPRVAEVTKRGQAVVDQLPTWLTQEGPA